MIGKRIQQYRKQRRLSLNELAFRAGVAKSYLSSIERNIQSNPSIEILIKVATVLGVEIEALIRDGTAHETDALEREWIQFAREVRNAGYSVEEARSCIALHK